MSSSVHINIKLKNFPDSTNGELLELVRIDDYKYGMGIISDLIAIGGSDLMPYSMSRDGMEITYSYGTQIIGIEKVYNFHNSKDHIELQIKIKNYDGRQITLDYGIRAASNIDKAGAFGERYVETNSKINGKVLRKHNIE